ncbi:MAG: putative rane-associated protein [Candidatus Saccharibacteria bacterium]|nr:putative rane-associated protein [Candidatus Saccharibacteria bacterium]
MTGLFLTEGCLVFSNLIQWFDRWSELFEHLITSQSILAPLLLLFIEEAGIPILVPGDVILAYTGYKVSTTTGEPLLSAFIVALVSVLAGSSILFYLSRRFGKRVVNGLGKFMFIEKSHIAKAEGLFRKYGVWTIIFGRHIPGMRIPITIFAATSGITYRVFIFATFISTAAWILFYLYIGKRYGHNLHHTLQNHHMASLIVLIVLVCMVFALHFRGRWKAAQTNQ